MKKTRWIWAALTFVVLTALLLGTALALLVPHNKAANPEAFLLADYFEADTGSDEVVFLGDCEVYEALSPALLWREYGITARVCGTPQQLMWHSYAILEEVLKHSSPRVVVLGVYGLIYDEPQNEAYNRMVFDHLPASKTKWRVLRDAMTEGESLASYVFPLLRYHDRWTELTWRDVTTLFEESGPVSVRGYLMQTGIVPGDAPNHEGALPPRDGAFGGMALDYFDRIVSLCREKGIELVLIKAPTDSWRYPWHDEYEAKAVALAEQYALAYYNFLNDFEAIGLDFSTDTYDAGLHLNVHGAEKLTAYFGKILDETYDLTDGRQDDTLAAAWQEDMARYEGQKEKGRELP
jgi:hypothetical protein